MIGEPFVSFAERARADAVQQQLWREAFMAALAGAVSTSPINAAKVAAQVADEALAVVLAKAYAWAKREKPPVRKSELEERVESLEDVVFHLEARVAQLSEASAEKCSACGEPANYDTLLCDGCVRADPETEAQRATRHAWEHALDVPGEKP